MIFLSKSLAKEYAQRKQRTQRWQRERGKNVLIHIKFNRFTENMASFKWFYGSGCIRTGERVTVHDSQSLLSLFIQTGLVQNIVHIYSVCFAFYSNNKGIFTKILIIASSECVQRTHSFIHLHSFDSFTLSFMWNLSPELICYSISLRPIHEWPSTNWAMRVTRNHAKYFGRIRGKKSRMKWHICTHPDFHLNYRSLKVSKCFGDIYSNFDQCVWSLVVCVSKTSRCKKNLSFNFQHPLMCAIKIQNPICNYRIIRLYNSKSKYGSSYLFSNVFFKWRNDFW